MFKKHFQGNAHTAEGGTVFQLRSPSFPHLSKWYHHLPSTGHHLIPRSPSYQSHYQDLVLLFPKQIFKRLHRSHPSSPQTSHIISNISFSLLVSLPPHLSPYNLFDRSAKVLVLKCKLYHITLLSKNQLLPDIFKIKFKILTMAY